MSTEPSCPSSTTAEELQAELARLRSENVSLAELNIALKEGNLALKDANTALKDLLASSREDRSALLSQQTRSQQRQYAESAAQTDPLDRAVGVATLPQEVLLQIFLSTIPPDHTYDPSVLSGSRNAWLDSVKTRRALPLVCKSWYGTGSEALYRDIVLQRMGQICALARTLRSSCVTYGPDPSELVQRLRLTHCIVQPTCMDVVKEDLTFVIEACAHLIVFEFHPHPAFDDELRTSEPHAFLHLNMLDDISENRTSLALCEQFGHGLRHAVFAGPLKIQNLRCIDQVLRAGTHLSRVDLGPYNGGAKVLHFSRSNDDVPIVLPHLTHLSLHVDEDHGRFLDYICESWKLPVLSHLTLHSCQELPTPLLAHIGLVLHYLHIIPSLHWDGSDLRSTLADLPTLCPFLEHLVLPHIPTLTLQCTIKSPTLQYPDIWDTLMQKRHVVELMCKMGIACRLPSLRTLRLLSWGSGDSSALPLILVLCHPTDISGDEVRVVTLPGVRLVQTSWAVLLDRGLGYAGKVTFINSSP
ncbi:hypothetical protein PYCCODRAFT_1463796 [Trametes coccinea BRFM310]|uniref:Uncharacterized protein n=1 Tax=Trametes coccinea (strain BRFM310) TaxID=1353009 RepID=A0A1Y2J2D4_TRAC3|nr:hypothetical protein PYCCODRAFT_1463796 [Trametes coccinea BRFM310]